MKIYKPIIGALMLLVCIGFLFFAKTKYYDPALEKDEQLETQIADYNTQIEALKEYRDIDADAAEAAVEEIQEKEEEWLGGFHGLYQDEDILLYVRDMEVDLSADISQVTLGTSGSITGIGDYMLSGKLLTFDYSATYEEFKSYVEYITSKFPQTSISSLTMTYDGEEETVSGTFSVILYYVEKEDYEEPDVIMDQGIENIFEAEGRLTE